MDTKEVKKILKKIWHFIWESDSVLSWLVNIVIAYFLIKFIIYPGLGYVFHTEYPIVAVVSGSMEHMKISHNSSMPISICGNVYEKPDYLISFDEYWEECGQWYKTRGIDKEMFSNFYFMNGFNKGDLIVIYGEEPKNLKIGDTIVFSAQPYRTEPIIHRIVGIHDVKGELFFETKGDHNPDVGVIDKAVNANKVLGKGVFRIPYLGWAKIWFVKVIYWIQDILMRK